MGNILGSILMFGGLSSLIAIIILILLLVLIFSVWYASSVLNNIKRLNEDILDFLESKERHKSTP